VNEEIVQVLRTGENWLSVGLAGSVHTTSPTAIFDSQGFRQRGEFFSKNLGPSRANSPGPLFLF
jgi:hypothetical protein